MRIPTLRDLFLGLATLVALDILSTVINWEFEISEGSSTWLWLFHVLPPALDPYPFYLWWGLVILVRVAMLVPFALVGFNKIHVENFPWTTFVIGMMYGGIVFAALAVGNNLWLLLHDPLFWAWV